jgi:RNA polymerase sigma factor (sigma-70 family)
MTEDIEVIEQVLGGRKEAYAELMKRYNQRLYRIGKAYLSYDADVEDAMQETYVKAYQGLGDYKRNSLFGTWLTRIMINECLLTIRQKQRNKSTEYNEKAMNYESRSNPEAESLNRELGKHLENSIMDLPEKYRVVFMMREVEKLSIGETSEALSISEGNVKARLSRAREMLRSALLNVYPVSQVFHLNAVHCDRIIARVLARI